MIGTRCFSEGRALRAPLAVLALQKGFPLFTNAPAAQQTRSLQSIWSMVVMSHSSYEDDIQVP